MTEAAAIRAVVRGRVQGVGFRDATVRRAAELGVLGWIRNSDDGHDVQVHAEGAVRAVDGLVAFLREGPRAARVTEVAVERVRVEGHEQFAVRGVPAGRFAVERAERGFVLRMQVAGTTRAWALPRGPSMDPADKRFAVGLDPPSDPADPGAPPAHLADAPTTTAPWDQGLYEQGGRVPWPEALARGHAVFVLHGERLRGGFALQRTRGAGAEAQWLLVKRRDEHARPGSDVIAECADPPPGD